MGREAVGVLLEYGDLRCFCGVFEPIYGVFEVFLSPFVPIYGVFEGFLSVFE
jgi:hypothetical protein